MKKGALSILLGVALTLTLVGCGADQEDSSSVVSETSVESETVDTAEETAETSDDLTTLSGITYTTVTEGYDWGPAISKVILNMGTELEPDSISETTFHVTSVREYIGFNYVTMTADTEITPYEEDRNVLAAYLSDAEGNAVDTGSYITIEMEVGPTITAGSPFNYDFMTGLNSYVDTSYVIALNEGVVLKTTNGENATIDATDKAGYQGNISLLADDFDLSGTYTEGDISLTYASFIPETASMETASNPLIIWLHGAGEGGTDPSISILGNKVVNLSTPEIQSYFGDTGAYILAPQAPTMWMDVDGSGTYTSSVEGSQGESYYTEALMGLIDEYVTSHPEIDPNRIYLGGCSNGGYMTMNMITTYPDYFAAAYPVCEAFMNTWLTEEKLEAIVDMPIWFTHAKTDGTVSIYEGTFDYMTYTFSFTLDENGNQIPIFDFSNAAYDRLIEAGAENVHYSLFENVVDTTGNYYKTGTTEPYEYMGHWSWIYTLNNQCEEEIDGTMVSIFEWMSQQTKEVSE